MSKDIKEINDIQSMKDAMKTLTIEISDLQRASNLNEAKLDNLISISNNLESKLMSTQGQRIELGPQPESKITGPCEGDQFMLQSERQGSISNEKEIRKIRKNSREELDGETLITEVFDFQMTSEQSLYFNDQCEKFILHIQPTEENIQYRTSIVKMLKKNIRIALNFNSIVTGLYENTCCLPDDPIKLSIIAPESSCTALDIRKLLMQQLQSPIQNESYSSHYANGAVNNSDSTHLISNINVAKHNVGFKLTCLVDHLVEVEISLNNRSDLWVIAFIEEVNTLVGNNNLFTRSILLVRAWWFYETSVYMGGSIKHYLSDHSLFIMICAIFNQYSATITSPFDALCMFLNEYAQYKGQVGCITIQGIVPFTISPISNSDIPKIDKPTAKHLISTSLIEKYSYLLISDLKEHQSKMSNEDCSLVGNINEIFNEAWTECTGDFYQDMNKLDAILKACIPIAPNRQAITMSRIHYFTRSTFNILNPFMYSNTITISLSHTRLTKLSKAFRMGKSKLKLMLKQASNQKGVDDNSKNGSIGGIGASLLSFFPVLSSRFKIDINADLCILKHASHTLSMSKLWQKILYCGLLLNSYISNSGLLLACVEILLIKGPLPIQKLGYCLTEMIQLPNLISRLNKCYGSLKDFLGTYPHLFVFIQEQRTTFIILGNLPQSIEDILCASTITSISNVSNQCLTSSNQIQNQHHYQQQKYSISGSTSISNMGSRYTHKISDDLSNYNVNSLSKLLNYDLTEVEYSSQGSNIIHGLDKTSDPMQSENLIRHSNSNIILQRNPDQFLLNNDNLFSISDINSSKLHNYEFIPSNSGLNFLPSAPNIDENNGYMMHIISNVDDVIGKREK